MSEPSSFSLGQTWQKPPADLWVIIAKLDYRVRELEKALHGVPEAQFTASGAFTTGVKLPRKYARYRYDLKEVRASLGTAGSTSTTGSLLRNSSSIWNFTLASGVYTTNLETGLDSGDREDYFQVEVTAVGTGATDLVVEFYTVRTD